MPADPLFARLAHALRGRYTMVRELGQGGMATVYLGTDVKLSRQVAIKALPPSTRAFLGSGRFQREVLLAAQLSHPHIVPLFEADEADGILFYVMEYVEGESLAERLRRDGPLPLDEALRITADVGDALYYAHQRGVIHRDVKPGNIMLAHGHALVTDFGVAKLLEQASDPSDPLTGTGITVGTVEYMSPEQAGGGRVDARADIYGLAAVLYEMLAGEPPFTGPSVQAIVARVRSEPPRPIRTLRPTLPPYVEQGLAAGLAKVPGDRPPTARAFVERVSRPVPARWLGRRMAGWLALGVAALAAVWAVRAVMHARRRPAPLTGMALVPAGLYRVGGAPGRDTMTVQLNSFYIDSTEVSVAAYQRFLAAVPGVTPWRERPPDDWPVTGVLWAEAAAYCRWRDPAGRLPTEDEWEAAARAPQGLRYPWGDAWARGRANAGGVKDTLAPVGEFAGGVSWVGAVDLIGNAWEWTSAASVSSEGGRGHVIKGGAFNTLPKYATGAYRVVYPEERSALGNTGFRCARLAP